MATRKTRTFDHEVVVEFLRKSYFAVDGLWFIRLESEHSYNEALRLDRQVWEVMPVIQARKARALLGIEGGSLADLARSLELKFAAEGCDCHITDATDDSFMVETSTCPWLAVLDKTGQSRFARDICDRICVHELEAWAGEFSPNIKFEFRGRLSDGDSACRMVFTKAVADTELPIVVEEG